MKKYFITLVAILAASFFICKTNTVYAKTKYTKEDIVTFKTDLARTMKLDIFMLEKMLIGEKSFKKEPEEEIYLTLCNESDRDILYRIVEAEATDGTEEQKRNVASCILNRVDSDEWPNSIEGVVFQKGQFSPLSDGRYYSVKIQQSTIDAVDYILAHGAEHDCIFFCTPTCRSAVSGWFSTLRVSFCDGMHNYYTGRKL